MGCDIHGVVQAKVNEEWKIINTPFNWERDYSLFGFLANVRERNVYSLGYPKGLPEDFNVFEQHGGLYCKIPCGVQYRKQFGSEFLSLGDHSFSWHTFCEIFAGKALFTQHVEQKFPGFYDLTYFFENLEETMKLHGDESKENYRMVFGFDS